jgi:uncharacterized protein (UPF0276 family)
MYDSHLPYLGFGLGLRSFHLKEILETLPPIDWFEIMTEHFLSPNPTTRGGRPAYYLNKICEHYPVVMHGVSLSIGSTDPLNFAYLKQVKQLAEQSQAKWISDHLCWSAISGAHLHDLLPLAYTEATIKHVVKRIEQVQEFLGRQILLENVSSYVTYKASEMSEWEFYREVVTQSDCLMLLDLNNIHVSAHNHGFSPQTYLDAIPKDRVQQFHLAGHNKHGNYLVDTHDDKVIEAVWDLYQMAIERFGKVSTMIERDDRMPPLSELVEELRRAKTISDKIVGAHGCAAVEVLVL